MKSRDTKIDLDITHTSFKDILYKNKVDRWTSPDGKIINLSIGLYKLNLIDTEYSYDKYISCCYILIFNKKLYYYIGSTTNIIDRVKTHYSNIQNIIKDNYNYTKPFSSILPYFFWIWNTSE